MTDDPWHHARPELARRALETLTRGPSKALTLFAPRRTGKTEFLLKDLVPLASARGHRIVYVSFWQASLAPLATLLHALETSLSRGTVADRLRRGARALAPKLVLSAPLPGADTRAEIDLTAIGPTPPAEFLLYLDDLLDRLTRRRKPMLLLLDEVQELARDERNRPLVASLRTGLDTRSERIKAIFTGSSREGLRAMFSKREAPFFHFATPLDLEPLGTDFVDHVLRVGERTTGRSLDRDAAVESFDALHRNPYFFRLLIETSLLDPALGMAEAVERVRERLGEELRYPETWLALSSLQRAVARALAAGIERPFGAETRAGIASTIGVESVSSSRLQAALKRLAVAGLADNYTGRWAIEDPAFAEWVRVHGEL